MLQIGKKTNTTDCYVISALAYWVMQQKLSRVLTKRIEAKFMNQAYRKISSDLEQEWEQDTQ